MLLPGLRASAQQLDGDFEGEKTWTNKAGDEREIKAPTLKDKNRLVINRLLAEGKFAADTAAGDEEAFQGWAEYHVRAISWKENLASLPTLRKELKKNLIRIGKAPSQDLHTRLNDLALTVLSEAAQDPRYPRAIRYNCMLMLGELDEREYNSNTGEKAKPLPAATTVMLKATADPKQHLFVRLAAANGLRRHVQHGVAAPLQGQLADALLGVLKVPVTEGRDRDGQIWLRWVSADLLHAMKQEQIPVDQTKLATSLVALVGDEKMPTWGRAMLAGELGQLDGRSLAAAQMGPAVRSLASLMLTISQASPFATEEGTEDAAEKVDDKKTSDKKGTEKKDPEKKKEDQADPAAVEEVSPTVQKLSSEEMIWQLSQIRLALFGKNARSGKDASPSDTQGLYMAADEANKASMKKMVGRIDELVKLLAGVPNNLAELADSLRSANQELEDLLSAPVAEQAQTAKTNKAGVQRTAPPQGNAPAGASAVSE